MKKQRIFFYSILLLMVLSTWIFLTLDTEETAFSGKVKIALRDVGNKLLLSKNDSTSLILPVKKIENAKYELSFESQLTFEPSMLVTIVENSFKKAALPAQYRVEVIQCDDGEVGYSYQMTEIEESTIIPCRSRLLPKNCYTIEVHFTPKETSFFTVSTIVYIVIFIIFMMMELFFFRKANKVQTPKETSEPYAAIGSFHFYPSQNKLVKQATEINLSKKECELLQIFAENLNQIVTREELTKKVWEDNGVIVGRSLDTYISKLRKKLKDDENIKITNVHGVGYRLELF